MRGLVRQVRARLLGVVELNAEHRIRQCLEHLALHLQHVLLRLREHQCARRALTRRARAAPSARGGGGGKELLLGRGVACRRGHAARAERRRYERRAGADGEDESGEHSRRREVGLPSLTACHVDDNNRRASSCGVRTCQAKSVSA